MAEQSSLAMTFVFSLYYAYKKHLFHGTGGSAGHLGNRFFAPLFGFGRCLHQLPGGQESLGHRFNYDQLCR